MNKDEVLQLASDSGARMVSHGLSTNRTKAAFVTTETLLIFANACEKIGMEEAEERAAILQDSAYVAGMKFGWNCCCNDNSAAFEKAIEDRINERVQLRAHKE